MIVKALFAELQKLCDAINHAVDLTEFTSKMNDMKLFDSFLMWRNGHGGIYAAAVGGYRTSASFGSVNPTILMP
ncbi:hypothetical protein Golax_025379 [Gossypium laxum]|uniref:Uncharacterized protein n=1 Tax=Gossypium laxum TaxID=34288 RepID=A0A7J9B2E5_9ROSI|nr:hypothetical protein [Gossypium laxum]